MPERRSIVRHALGVACLVLSCAATAGAQQPDQPLVVPAPEKADFMSRGDFQLSAAALADSDIRYGWDTHWGGSLDVVDYVKGRLGVYADYEALLGDEFRVFDPNQGNYTLETFATVRLNESTEIMGMFHHVSRHLSDRPKRIAIAWNLAGARLLHRMSLGQAAVDFDLEAGKITEYAFVDYSWIAEFHMQVRRPVNDHLTVYGRGMAQWIGVNGEVPSRGRQSGGFAEGGIRLKGSGPTTLELFAGVERRVDADQFERLPERWGFAGFRLLSR